MAKWNIYLLLQAPLRGWDGIFSGKEKEKRERKGDG
jgi:hypothetical protein